MSLWRRNNDWINIILCREGSADPDFERHKFEPAYLGYNARDDGKIGEIIDNVLIDLNNPLPKDVERKGYNEEEHSELMEKIKPYENEVFIDRMNQKANA
ncbi:MAG: hypothetical protein LBE91_02945 [Tannerella sp.]|jgi:hypothetical protein|nr:hypothetical protein [Tannerella sp.]